MIIDEILIFLSGNLYAQSLALFLTIISGFIAIHQLFFKESDVIELRKEDDIKVNDYARGLCADCNSFISSNSSFCPKCGSSKPFDLSSLKKILKKELRFNFLIVENYVNNKKDIDQLIKVYNYLFLFCVFFIALISPVLEVVNIYFFTIVGALILFGVLMSLFTIPHSIIDKYTYVFDRKKGSRESLLNLDQKIFSITNSLKDKEALQSIKNEISEHIENIESHKRIKKNSRLSLVIYIFLQLLLLLSIGKVIDISRMNNFFDELTIMFFLLGLFYACLLAIFRIYWIHFIYFPSIADYGKSNLRNYLYLLDKRLDL